jgi:hypothetical protein
MKGLVYRPLFRGGIVTVATALEQWFSGMFLRKCRLQAGFWRTNALHSGADSIL